MLMVLHPQSKCTMTRRCLARELRTLWAKNRSTIRCPCCVCCICSSRQGSTHHGTTANSASERVPPFLGDHLIPKRLDLCINLQQDANIAARSELQDRTTYLPAHADQEPRREYGNASAENFELLLNQIVLRCDSFWPDLAIRFQDPREQSQRDRIRSEPHALSSWAISRRLSETACIFSRVRTVSIKWPRWSRMANPPPAERVQALLPTRFQITDNPRRHHQMVRFWFRLIVEQQQSTTKCFLLASQPADQ